MRPNAKAQKLWVSLMHPFGTKKAQALVEVTVLGTVLLFALGLLLYFGMNANYQQKVDMQSFRKAFAEARATTEHAYPNITYVLVEDKPIPSASPIVAIPEREPVMAKADALWTNDIFGDAENDEDLPRTIYEINARRNVFHTRDLNIEDGGLKGRRKHLTVDDSSLQREENSLYHATREIVHAEEEITHTIKTGSGNRNVSRTFRKNREETWLTPKE